MTAFCDPNDVQLTLQKLELKGAIDFDNVQPAIEGASSRFARVTNGHWYDSNGGHTLITDSVATGSDVRLDIPSSPHRQDRLLFSSRQGVRYPVSTHGPFAEIRLPHLYVTTLNKLEVRDRDGDVTDWVADSGFAEGRDEDYYLQQRGQSSYGRSYLYIRTGSIGTRTDYSGLLTLGYDYGLDYQTANWDDVKRGVANLAAAEVMDDDDVLAQIPDNGQLVGIQTQHDNLVNAARNYLNPYITSVAAFG